LPDAVALGLATFRGAAPDGRLHVNGANQLIIDRQLRYWLDSWLSVQGELSLEQVLELITERMNQLPDPGRTEALALLDAYLGYRNQLASYDDRTGRSLTSGDLEALQQRLDWTERLRLQWFTAAVSQAFFAQDDILDQRFLAQQALRQAANTNAHTNTEDDSNSTMVLEQQLQALEQQLAPELQQARSQSRRLITLQQGEQQLARQGADSDTLQQWRSAQFGEQAAQRLAVLDQQRQLWQQRLQDYATLSGQLSGQQGEQALARYRTEHFTTTEQKRLKAALQLLP
jgi:lipase chaperone LimK